MLPEVTTLLIQYLNNPDSDPSVSLCHVSLIVFIGVFFYCRCSQRAKSSLLRLLGFLGCEKFTNVHYDARSQMY